MAVNLVSLVSEFLTPELAGRMAQTLGLDVTKAMQALRAAVPALFVGMLDTAKQPAGAAQLATAANEQARMLDGTATQIAGGSTTGLVDTGTRLAGSLLGPRQDAISGAVANFANIPPGTANSLLGMLTPIVLGVLGKQAGPGGFQASSLTNLLEQQKNNIFNAMPPAFAGALESTGMMDTAGLRAAQAATSTTTAEPPRRAAAAATAQPQRYAPAPQPTRGVPNWLYWLIPLLVILALLWYFVGNRPREEATTPAVAPAATAPAQGIVVGGVDLTQQLGNSLGTIRNTLQGVTDPATAQAAVPALQQASAALDTASNALNQATPAQKTVVQSAVAPTIATINQLFDKVMAIPGVGDVLRPAVDTLKSKLAAFQA